MILFITPPLATAEHFTYDDSNMAQTSGKLKAILFDKDGTLFDYAQVWEDVLRESIEHAFTKMGKADKKEAKRAMLRLMGIDDEGQCLPGGLVFTHRRVQIFRRFFLYCLRWRVNAVKAIRAYHQSVADSEIILTEKLSTMDFSVQQRLFARLKEKGWVVGVITSDNASSTDLFLKLMGLSPYVDFVSSRDSHYRRKPHPEAFRAFCKQFNLQPHQVVMVGDTITDMLFAKRAKAGYTIALLSGSRDLNALRRLSDVTYHSIDSLEGDKRLFDE
ncbi:MAG: HAD family hydrolase [Sphaerochaeta sp.]|jgi:phosphoglycolate phosphatase